MPGRNATKIYVEEGYYHIYNRGVEKRNIFQDDQDYAVFLNYMDEYLSPRDENDLYKRLADPGLSTRSRGRLGRRLTLKNFSPDITIMAYCLMPNHFHFFLKQGPSQSIDNFMSSLCTRYAIYFNRKNKRVGHLFQGVYKAALIEDEAHYLHISRYIHQQALVSAQDSYTHYPSSYPEYVGLRKTDWVHPDEILTFFSKTNPTLSYQKFVADYTPVDQESTNELEY